VNAERRNEQENGGAKSPGYQRSVYRQKNRKRPPSVAGIRLNRQVGHVNFHDLAIPTPWRVSAQTTTADFRKSCVRLESLADTIFGAPLREDAGTGARQEHNYSSS
jgi:hypothetical protein